MVDSNQITFITTLIQLSQLKFTNLTLMALMRKPRHANPPPHQKI